MKGRISSTLQSVLSDPKGREQLKAVLLRGQNGKIVSSGKAYIVKLDVTKKANTHSK